MNQTTNIKINTTIPTTIPAVFIIAMSSKSSLVTPACHSSLVGRGKPVLGSYCLFINVTYTKTPTIARGCCGLWTSDGGTSGGGGSGRWGGFSEGDVGEPCV